MKDSNFESEMSSSQWFFKSVQSFTAESLIDSPSPIRINFIICLSWAVRWWSDYHGPEWPIVRHFQSRPVAKNQSKATNWFNMVKFILFIPDCLHYCFYHFICRRKMIKLFSTDASRASGPEIVINKLMLARWRSQAIKYRVRGREPITERLKSISLKLQKRKKNLQNQKIKQLQIFINQKIGMILQKMFRYKLKKFFQQS